ncbi:MAG: heavy metal translocating P-type ATPase [Eubacteriales bacterium]|nr:heavy metal translocating P-type ATPase [Eubacteriales bacterium]
MSKKQKKVLRRIVISAILLIGLHFINTEGRTGFVLYMIPYLIIGYDILKKAAYGVKNLQPFDENFLMAAATVGAVCLGEYSEGVAVMLFYQIGELFQSYAVGKSRRSISELMDIRPDCAYIENENGELESVDPDDVAVGTIITVRPGDRIPIDGTVIEGSSSLNTSALTGESVPRNVAEGDAVISGCINLSGKLHIRTDKEFGESTVSRILELVENAGSRKSRSENFISRFAYYYTPAVCGLALLLMVLPPLFSIVQGNAPGFGTWVYRALTFLVISCPCALVISIPLTFFAGIGGAGKAGVLVKGSVFLEALSKVGTVVFDKTGTLTEGVFEVSDVLPEEGYDRERLLGIAAAAELYSTHPVSRSIERAFGKRADAAAVSDVREIGGKGVMAMVNGREVYVGNAVLMKDAGIMFNSCSLPGTIVYIAEEGKYAGCIVVSDRIKKNSLAAISELSKTGIRTVMLTGDVKSAAEAVAFELGVNEVRCELLPEDKVSELERIIDAQPQGRKTAFAGDGINDAPVLSRADIGIAMGALGSDAAIEAADIVLMDDDPMKIPKAVRISKKCMAIVYENIWFAIGIKILCLILGAMGIADMWAAIFADVGVMVIAVLNAIRALSVSKL